MFLLVSAPTFRRPKKRSGDLAVGMSVEFGASGQISSKPTSGPEYLRTARHPCTTNGNDRVYGWYFENAPRAPYGESEQLGQQRPIERRIERLWRRDHLAAKKQLSSDRE